MRRVAVVTVGRSDYGIYRPLLRVLGADPRFELRLVVGGEHVQGGALRAPELEADGLTADALVDCLSEDDSPAGIASAMGRAVSGFAAAFQRLEPDLVVVLGDRFEMHAAGLAALPLTLPVAHLHGGELTRAAMDDALRHSLTKLSHLHFVSAEPYAARVRQLGEDPRHVHVVGALALEQLEGFQPWSAEALARSLDASWDTPPLVVTFHPVTLEHELTTGQVTELLAALAPQPHPLVFTRPNADTHGRVITAALEAFVADRPRAWLVDGLGIERYWSLLSCAAAMVGNSSSGPIEAASFRLPVVNVGDRQAGRLRPACVIDVACEREAIRAGIDRALDPGFRASLSGQENPLRRQGAAARIAEALAAAELGPALIQKRFQDLPAEDGP